MTHTSTEQPELLPCPFCGGKAGETHYQLGWFIACKHECSASTQVTKTLAQAIAAWNRRTTASKAQRTPLQGLHILDVFFEANEGVVQGKYPDIEHGVLRETERAHGITQEKQG